MSLYNKFFLKTVSPLLRQVEDSLLHPKEAQQKVFDKIIGHGEKTYYGREFSFHEIDSIQTFKKRIPIKTFSQLIPYINLIKRNRENILWDRAESLFADNVPVSSEMLRQNFFKGARILTGSYIEKNPDSNLLSGKLYANVGELKKTEDYFDGDISTILTSNLPFCFSKHIVPNGNGDFCKECIKHTVTAAACSIEYFIATVKKLIAHNNTPYLSDIWPELELIAYGPKKMSEIQKKIISDMLPKKNITFINCYLTPAGFFAYQNDPDKEDMLLLLNCGVYYEFIPLSDVEKALNDPFYETLDIDSIEVGKRYMMIVSTASGLWRIMLDEVVEFTSTVPYKILYFGNLSEYRKKEEEVKLLKKVSEQPVAPKNDQRPAEHIFRIKKPKKQPETTGHLFSDELFG